jgi:hypothetical protein
MVIVSFIVINQFVVWFYNCNVYAKLAEGSRIKFDIFDNIEEKLRKKR